MRHRIAVAIIALGVIASAVPLFGKVKQEFIPSDVDEAEFGVSITAPQDTSLASMDRAARQVENDLRSTPGVQTVLTQVGGGFSGEVNTASYYVRIAPHEQRLFSLARLWARGTLPAIRTSTHSRAIIRNAMSWSKSASA